MSSRPAWSTYCSGMVRFRQHSETNIKSGEIVRWGKEGMKGVDLLKAQSVLGDGPVGNVLCQASMTTRALPLVPLWKANYTSTHLIHIGRQTFIYIRKPKSWGWRDGSAVINTEPNS